MWQLHPALKKVTPSFPATPSKSWGPVKPSPLFENLVEGSTPQQKGAAHYGTVRLLQQKVCWSTAEVNNAFKLLPWQLNYQQLYSRNWNATSVANSYMKKLL